VPIIPIIPGMTAPPLAAPAAVAAVAHNAAAAAAGAQVAAALPNQGMNRPAGIPFSGSSTPLVDPQAGFAAAHDPGAVGTTMKVITLIQAQRVWSRGHQKSHHPGSRRRFR
jgi:hypothetical protein